MALGNTIQDLGHAPVVLGWIMLPGQDIRKHILTPRRVLSHVRLKGPRCKHKRHIPSNKRNKLECACNLATMARAVMLSVRIVSGTLSSAQ